MTASMKDIRELMGWFPCGVADPVWGRMSRRQIEAHDKLHADGLVERNAAGDCYVLSDKGKRWMQTYDRTHPGRRDGASAPINVLDDEIEGVPHSVIGEVMVMLEGQRRAGPVAKGLTDEQLAAFMLAHERAWITAEDNRFAVTHEGMVWLISSLQEDLANEIAEKRMVVEKRSNNPLWATW